jgi:hypothetical protein
MNTFLLCALVVLIAIGWRSILDAALIAIVLIGAIFVFLPCMVAIETARWVRKRV